MSKNFNKAITIRFSFEDYYKIQEEAEKRESSLADIVRGSWKSYHQQQQLQQLLSRMEQRQRAFHFELLSTLLNLDSNERKEAFQTLIDKGVKF